MKKAIREKGTHSDRFVRKHMDDIYELLDELVVYMDIEEVENEKA